MKKAKVITTLALTVVMLAAMTGLVVGYGGNIDATDSGGGSISLFAAGDKVYATGLLMTPDDSFDIYVTNDASPDWSDGDNIASTKTVVIKLTGVTEAQLNGAVYLGDVSNAPGGIPYPTSGTYAYDIAVDLDQDGVYETTGVPTHCEDFVEDVPFGCKAFETEIPEFATIAIPVASILGLVLFFNHRKRKKE